MTDATVQANPVRLRARLENGQALVEHLRRRHNGGGVEPAGVYRRVWPHQLEIPRQTVPGLKALVAGLPLVKFAEDPDEAEAFAGLMPRRPHSDGSGAPAPQSSSDQQAPKRRGYLAAQYRTGENDS